VFFSFIYERFGCTLETTSIGVFQGVVESFDNFYIPLILQCIRSQEAYIIIRVTQKSDKAFNSVSISYLVKNVYSFSVHLYISFCIRGTETGQKLWEYLEGEEIENVITDHWKAYAEFFPETIHTRSKAEMYTVEEYNSIFRHFVARLRRKTK